MKNKSLGGRKLMTQDIILLTTAIIGTVNLGLQLGILLFLIIDGIRDNIKRRKGNK